MKKVVFLYLFVFFNHENSSAQELDSSIAHIDSLLLNKENVTSNLFTDDVLDRYIYSQISKLSGANIKEGKVASKSISVDEKSATFNFAYKANNKFYIQPTATATSDKGFVDVFSNKEYQRTYTVGSNFQYFLGGNSIYFSKNSATELHNNMKFKKVQFEKFEKNVNSKVIDELIKNYHDYYNKNSFFLDLFNENQIIDYNYLANCTQQNLEGKQKIDEIIDKLIKMKFLDADAKSKTYKRLNCQLDCCIEEHKENVLKASYISFQDSLQLNAKVGRGIKWITGSVKYNTSVQQILLDTSKTTTSKYYNEYATLKAGYNYLNISINNNKFYLNLNANYSSIRNFNPKKIRTTNFVTNSTLGNVPVQKIDSSISYYTSIPSRANAMSCDLNLAYFFFKQNFGLDFGVTAGVNDPLDNNVNARFGIYIPFTAGDKIVYVEPILKFNKLFSSSGNEFLKDNFSFGFNVSVALPDFLKPNK